MERRRATRQAITLGVAMLISACSGSADDLAQADPTDPVEATIAPSVSSDDELFGEREEITAVDDEGQPVQPVQPVTESLPAVPETGVPGIESDDAFCRSWSTYAGSVQALSLAWELQPPEDAAALEVAATAAIMRAVEGMADDLPADIEPNRDALTVDVPAPLLRRAERANTLLVDAGLDQIEIDELGARWVAAITEQGVESETLSIDVPAASGEALDTAAITFAAELPSIVEDPSLDTTAFDISPSLDYIAANCPDQGTLAGNDVIDAGGT